MAFQSEQSMNGPATQMRTGRFTRPSSHGSRTLTVERSEALEAGPSSRENVNVGSLRLQGAAQEHEEGAVASVRHQRQRRVVWTDDTIDNEGCGKKKSKSTSE